jgi:general secretion pathway protein I
MRVERTPCARGFTLVEVLVALAIIAFGLIAVFSQLGQSATAAARLREKTLAHWVATEKLTELRLSRAFPGLGTSSDEIEMANTRWRYEIRISATEGSELRRADVSVAFADEPDRPVATATGFLAERAQAFGVGGTGWPVVAPGAGLPGDGGQGADGGARQNGEDQQGGGASSGGADNPGTGDSAGGGKTQ